MSEEPPRKQARMEDLAGSCRAFGGSDTLPMADANDEYHLLDEVTADNDDDGGSLSDFSDESGMSNEEIDALLEEGLPDQISNKNNCNSSAGPEKQVENHDAPISTTEPDEDYTLIDKTVIADGDTLYGPFDKLPEGWVMVSHCSGIHVYLHRASRVCTMSRPYFIGRGSARRHSIPLSAIPCLLYRRKKEERLKKQSPEKNDASGKEVAMAGSSLSSETSNTLNVDTTSPAESIAGDRPSNVSAKFSELDPTFLLKGHSTGIESASVETSNMKENASDVVDDTNDGRCETQFPHVSGKLENPGSICDSSNAVNSNVSACSESYANNSESPICPMKDNIGNSGDTERSSTFNTALAVALNIQPANPPPTADQLPGASRVTFEPLSLVTVEPDELNAYCSNLFDFEVITTKKFGNWRSRRRYDKRMRKMQPPLPEGTKLLTLKPNSNTDEVMAFKKKIWLLNPANRSSICILHEYVQRVLKSVPSYQFKEVDNASCPYAAALFIDGLEYATGYGNSKRMAKAEAASGTLKILMPELSADLESNKNKSTEPDTTFFDQIRIEDPNVPELCSRMSELPPYSLLLVCLQRNYCLDGNNITCSLIPQKGQRNEFEMTVGKHTVRVPCRNKKEGKQKASQALLQKLHPHITSWGSMLRLYGNKSLQELKAKKKEEQEVTLLQNNATANQPNYSIINLLKKEMLKLHEEKLAIQPIGTFVPPENVQLPAPSSTDLNTLDI